MYDKRRHPRRPALPPSLYALVALLYVERAMLKEGKAWLGATTGRGVVIVAVIVLVCCIVVRSVRNTCILVLVTLLAALVVSSLQVTRQTLLEEALVSTWVSTWEFCTQSDSSEAIGGFRCRATAIRDGRSFGDVWLVTPRMLEIHSVVGGSGRCTVLEQDEWGMASRMQGVCATVSLTTIVRLEEPRGLWGRLGSLRNAVLETFAWDSTDERALLAGCVCGWRTGLSSKGVDELFSRCGTSHLIAVSGSHLSVLVGMLETALIFFRLGPRLRSVLLVGLSGIFVILCGAPPSALRAWAMLVSSLLGNLVGRRAHSLSGACLVGLCMALLDPAISGRLGFLLSVASVVGLCVFAPFTTYVLDSLIMQVRLPSIIPRKLRNVVLRALDVAKKTVAMSLTAQFATLPFVAQSFGEISLVGPLANMLVGLPFTLLVAVGIVAGAMLGVPPIQHMLLLACDVLASLVLGLMRFVDSLPVPMLQVRGESPVAAICISCLAIVLVAWPRISKRGMRVFISLLICVFAALFARWRMFAPPRICILDVGQGDAILVQDGPNAILVDAGPDGSIVEALSRKHVLHLDAVILTHLHDDHYGGLNDLAGQVPCDQVVVAEGVSSNISGELLQSVQSLCEKKVLEVSHGDVLHVGNFNLKVVSPVEKVDGNENVDSLELLVEYRSSANSLIALLTGDAEQDVTGAALERGELCDIDLLKVGHHGSKASITADQARELDPEISVASAGEENSYGHPDPTCVQVLRESGSEFLCTKDVGDVEVRPGDKGPEVRFQH